MTYWEMVYLALACVLSLTVIVGIPSFFVGLVDGDEAALVAGILMILIGVLAVPALLTASGVLA